MAASSSTRLRLAHQGDLEIGSRASVNFGIEQGRHAGTALRCSTRCVAAHENTRAKAIRAWRVDACAESAWRPCSLAELPISRSPCKIREPFGDGQCLYGR